MRILEYKLYTNDEHCHEINFYPLKDNEMIVLDGAWTNLPDGQEARYMKIIKENQVTPVFDQQVYGWKIH